MKRTKKSNKSSTSPTTHPLDPVPSIVKVVTEFVEREGLLHFRFPSKVRVTFGSAITLEGIYRISGIVKEVETISKALVKYTSTNVLPNFSKYDPFGYSFLTFLSSLTFS